MFDSFCKKKKCSISSFIFLFLDMRFCVCVLLVLFTTSGFFRQTEKQQTDEQADFSVPLTALQGIMDLARVTRDHNIGGQQDHIPEGMIIIIFGCVYTEKMDGAYHHARSE